MDNSFTVVRGDPFGVAVRIGRMQTRRAIRDDIGPAAQMLASAFADDPWFQWLYPESSQWPDAPAAWFRLVLDRVFDKGHTYLAAHAACAWIPPDVEFPSEFDVGLAVDLLSSQIGERAAEALGVIGSAGASFQDRPPRFHCVYVGVPLLSQRQGAGSALLARILNECDAEGFPASLTSTNDVNLSLYRSLGFVEINEIPIPGTQNSMRPMWRDPQ